MSFQHSKTIHGNKTSGGSGLSLLSTLQSSSSSLSRSHTTTIKGELKNVGGGRASKKPNELKNDNVREQRKRKVWKYDWPSDSDDDEMQLSALPPRQHLKQKATVTAKKGNDESSSKGKGKGKGDGGGKTSKKSTGEVKSDGGGKASRKRKGELKNVDESNPTPKKPKKTVGEGVLKPCVDAGTKDDRENNANGPYFPLTLYIPKVTTSDMKYVKDKKERRRAARAARAAASKPAASGMEGNKNRQQQNAFGASTNNSLLSSSSLTMLAAASKPAASGMEGNKNRQQQIAFGGKKTAPGVTAANKVDNTAAYTKNLNFKKFQDAAGGDKETLMKKEIEKIVSNKDDELHGLVERNVEGDYHLVHGFLIKNSGGGPKGTEPGEPFRLLGGRVRFGNTSYFKYWFTEKSQKKHLGNQIFKWSDDTKQLSKSMANSVAWKNGTFKFVRVN